MLKPLCFFIVVAPALMMAQTNVAGTWLSTTDIFGNPLYQRLTLEANGSTVARFPATDPTKVEKFPAGFSGSGLGIDSQSNVWVTNRLGSSDRGKAIVEKTVATLKSALICQWRQNVSNGSRGSLIGLSKSN